MAKGIVHIDKDALRTLLANLRQDVRVGIVDKETAKQMLGLGEADFYNELNSPHTLIERSKSKKGKFIKSSIIREFQRIHGVPYDYAAAG